MRRFLLIALCLSLAPRGGFADTSAVDELRESVAVVGPWKWFRADSEQGARILRLESDLDPVVGDYLARHPAPDFADALGARALRLIYLNEDRLVRFKREAPSKSARISVAHPLPVKIIETLPAEARDMVRVVRAESAGDYQGFGSCFVVRPDGLVLTAYHNVEDAAQVRVRFEDGSSYDADVLERVADTDLALLQIPGLQLPYVSLDPKGVSLGTRVFTIGFPAPLILGDSPKFTEGAISSEQIHELRKDLMLVSLPVQQGNSGGPVASEDGSVLGVVIGTTDSPLFSEATGKPPQNVNWASRVDAVPPLFDAPPALPPARTRGEAIERVRAAVCLVDVGRR